MAELLRMPEVAAAATTAVLSAWPHTEGTTFDKGDAIVIVETEKAEVEIPADNDGVLLRTLVPAGAEVEVGSPIALLGAVGEAVADLDALLAQLGVIRQPDDTATMAVRRDLPDQPAPGGSPVTTEPEAADAASAERNGRVFSSPLARKMAREAGLTIADIPGSGPGGRVVRRDVTAAIATRAARPQPSAPHSDKLAAALVPAADGSASFEDIPHSRMRRTIADRLTRSKQTAPHFYLRATCRVDALLTFREQINAAAPQKVSVNDLLIKAIAKAHDQVPEMNAVWTPDAVRRFHQVDVSVAIATEGGLLTPVLRDVAAKSVSAIASEVRTYAQKAKTGGLRQEDLAGGSITITNLGMFGVEEFTAIINPPQSAILAVGAAREEPVVIDGALEVARVLRLVLAVDHRPIDGVVAARWMSALTTVLENPIQILI